VVWSDDPCWNTEMGMRSADAIRQEELHGKLSQISLQNKAAYVTDNNNLVVALEATVQVPLVHTCMSPETCDICGVHMGICKGAVDHGTLANHCRYHFTKPKTQAM